MGGPNDDDLKDQAQRLVGLDGPQPGEIYRHYKGGLYVVVCRSLQEDTLEPLVTYRSNLKGTFWTRTLANFTEHVSYAADNHGGSCPRFRREEG